MNSTVNLPGLIAVAEAAQRLCTAIKACRDDPNGGGPTGSKMLEETVDAEDALIAAVERMGGGE